MRTLKILGFLLTYPTEMHQTILDECQMLLHQENILSDKLIGNINELIEEIKSREILDIQDEYVSLFDRTPSLSLHIFEHIHGDSRERGQALVDLANLYERHGLTITAEETPDYLPLFLEYVSNLPISEINDNLSSIVNVTSAIGARLRNRESLYASIFDAISEVAACKIDPKNIEQALSDSSGEAYSLEQLDKEWEEQFAFDNSAPLNGQNDGCPRASEMLARMKMAPEEKRG